MAFSSTAAEGRQGAIRVGAFPSGKGVWRIDWFGDIAYPDRTARSSHPSVRVHLSQVSDSYKVGDLDLEAGVLGAKLRSSSPFVSVGTTMLLRIGDLWSRQTIVASPTYDEDQFTVHVGEGFSTVVKAGSSHADGSFMLPWEEHPGHMAATHSWCVQIALPDGQVLLVPAMELIRFYFGSSSALLNRLFTPPVSPCSFAQWSEYDGSSGLAKLVLADGISGASAHDVARAMFSRAAWHAAATVSNSCLKALHEGKRIYPVALFPFQGLTTLHVTGKWLSGSGQKEKTFVVFRIRSCSHPFPYRALAYRTGELAKSDKRLNRDASNNAEGKKTGSSPKVKNPLLNETDPSAELAAQTLSVPRTVRFPDLLKKRSWTDAMLSSGSEGETFSTRSKDPESVALGDRISGKSSRQVDITHAQHRLPSTPSPEYLDVFLLGLKNFQGGVAIITESDEDGWTIPFEFPLRALIDNDSSSILEESRLFALRLDLGGHRGILAVVVKQRAFGFLIPEANNHSVRAGDWLLRLTEHLRTVDVHEQSLVMQNIDDIEAGATQISLEIADWLSRKPLLVVQLSISRPLFVSRASWQA